MADIDARPLPDEELVPPEDQIDVEGLEGLTEKPKSFGKLAWERFLNHRLALVGAIGLVLIIALFFIAPLFSEYAFDERNVRDRLLGPSWDHPFGTDEIGRDLFVRTAQGGRYSLRIGFLADRYAVDVDRCAGFVER